MKRALLGLIAIVALVGVSIVLNASPEGGQPAHAESAGALPGAAPGQAACPMARAAGADCTGCVGRCAGHCAECDRCKGEGCNGNCADCANECPRAGACPLMGTGPAGAPIQATAENKKTWDKLESLMLKRHRAMWDYYKLVGAEQPDEAAVKAKGEELRALGGEMMLLQRSLRGNAAPAAAGRPMSGGMKTRGCAGGGCPMSRR